MAKPAAGARRSTQLAALAGRIATARMYGSTTTTITAATAAALRRRIAPTATARTATRATSAAVPAKTLSSVSQLTGRMYRPSFRSRGTPSAIDAMEAARPTVKATRPMTIALAARTRPRRGIAANVSRIRPRRYSAVKNMAATTPTAISAANMPARLCSMLLPGNPPPGPVMAGAMSPEPVSVTWLPD